MKKGLLTFLFLFIGVYFHGCIDEPVATNNVNINGTVYSHFGYPASFVNVSNGHSLIFKTFYNGRFMFENMNLPYNLLLYESDYRASVYLNIKNTNPSLIYESWRPSPFACAVVVNHPPIEGGQVIFLIFVSNKFYTQFSYRFNSVYPPPAEFAIEILPDESSISGKLIYLEAEEYGIIYYYNKYAVKDVTLYRNSVNEITFTENELAFNPDESDVRVDYFFPPGMRDEWMCSYLYFPQANTNSEFALDELYWGDNYWIFTIPVLPSIDYLIKIKDKVIADDGRASTKWIYVNPGENGQIVHNESPSLVLPLNGTTISDTSTILIKDKNEPGMYEFIFQIKGKHILNIYTDKKTFKINELVSKELKLMPDKTYRWYVNKYPNYNSIDEFVSTPFISDKRYTSIETSNFFIFNTSP